MCFKSTRHGAFFPLWRYNARVYKVVILVELTRPSPSSSRVRSARVVAAIDEMLHRTLTSSLQPNGTFTTVPTFFSSKAADFYFQVSFSSDNWVLKCGGAVLDQTWLSKTFGHLQSDNNSTCWDGAPIA
jgi:hypothetical protein